MAMFDFSGFDSKLCHLGVKTLKKLVGSDIYV